MLRGNHIHQACTIMALACSGVSRRPAIPALAWPPSFAPAAPRRQQEPKKKQRRSSRTQKACERQVIPLHSDAPGTLIDTDGAPTCLMLTYNTREPDHSSWRNPVAYSLVESPRICEWKLQDLPVIANMLRSVTNLRRTSLVPKPSTRQHRGEMLPPISQRTMNMSAWPAGEDIGRWRHAVR